MNQCSLLSSSSHNSIIDPPDNTACISIPSSPTPLPSSPFPCPSPPSPLPSPYSLPSPLPSPRSPIPSLPSLLLHPLLFFLPPFLFNVCLPLFFLCVLFLLPLLQIGLVVLLLQQLLEVGAGDGDWDVVEIEGRGVVEDRGLVEDGA